MNFLLNLLALCPLAFAPAVIYPYTSGKTLVIRAIVAIVSVLFFSRIITNIKFREQMLEQAHRLITSAIFRAVGIYFIVFIISAATATDRFNAFFGTFQRQEGVVGMLFFFGFFVYTTLLFTQRNWLWFFKLSMVSSVILFIHAMVQKWQGNPRPYSVVGNAIYLSAYFLFPILAGLIVYLDSRRAGQVGRIRLIGQIGLVAAIVSFFGVFLANSRGVIVGMAVGGAGSLIYLFWSLRSSRGVSGLGAQSTIRSMRIWLLVLLAVGTTLVGIFIATEQNTFWQQVPGLDRLAQSSALDTAIHERLYNASLTLAVMNPTRNGYKKFLFGWGPENYVLASTAYFDPQRYQRYDTVAVDRAHDKILDVFATNGLIGLVSYLAIWFFLFRFILFGRLDAFSNDKDQQRVLRSVLLFFSVAYFVQNLFAFDSVTTFLTFFCFVGFIVFLEVQKETYDQ